MQKHFLYIITLLLLLVSCGSYEKLLKSTDNKAKLEGAKSYYEKGKYMQAITLFDMVAPYYKGTSQSEEILYLTAKSNFGAKDYFTAASLFETYTKTFAHGKYVEECAYMIGYCHYLESPDTRLDQTETLQAISALDEFLDTYPASQYAPDAQKYFNELNDKLAEKAYLSAKLYFNLGNYQGNNYLSAIVTATNAIKDYPESKHLEDLSFLILESKYKQAEYSIPSKKEERYRETIDEYYNFIDKYGEGKYRKDADKILNSSKDHVSSTTTE